MFSSTKMIPLVNSKKWEKFEPLSHKKKCDDLKMLHIITAIYRENTIFLVFFFENSYFKITNGHECFHFTLRELHLKVCGMSSIVYK